MAEVRRLARHLNGFLPRTRQRRVGAAERLRYIENIFELLIRLGARRFHANIVTPASFYVLRSALNRSIETDVRHAVSLSAASR